MKKTICLTLLVCITFLWGCSPLVVPKEITKENETEKNEVVELPKEEVPKTSLSGKVIVIDAGHGINSYNKQEPIAPNTAETKIAFASGTSGKNQTEEELTLAVALRMQKKLSEKGALVHMTRTTHNSDMTNVDRAVFANELCADISVKIHADGNNDSSIKGFSVLIPGNQYIKDEDVLSKSKIAANYVIEEFGKETGAKNRGISVRNDLTGFNWSTVPIILVEMGFMTNPEEDSLMETDKYQEKMALGIINGVERYFDSLSAL